MTDAQQQPGNPVGFFVLGATVVPTFVLLTSYILWITTRNVTGIFWMAVALSGLFTLVSAFHMIASKWVAWRVSLFTTTISVLMGVCFAGSSVLGADWWLVVGMGLLFITMLIILFTDLDDYMKLPLIVLVMIVEFSAVWIFFKWLAQTV